MPDLDGVQAAARLAQAEELPRRLPVILVTAYDRELATGGAGEAAIDAVLHKPISPSTLHDTVLSVLAPATRRRRTAERPLPPAMPGKRVLLVEDNEINRQVAGQLLALAGLHVTEAHNGYQALERLSAESFDVVLMDVEMPELDGVETVKAIRAQERLRGLPVIAMTAHAMLGDRERFLDCGMTDYISKPIEEEQLLGVLSKWISADAAPGTVTPAAQKGDLPPMLPGLNVSDGVRRSSGNVDLYRRLLGELRKDLDEQSPRIAVALKQSNMKEALELLHSLKGCAATLGARRVSEGAAALELRLRRGEPVALNDLEAASTELKESIGRVVVTTAKAATSLPPLDRSLLLPIARRLDEQLEANNFGAVKCFE